MAARENGAVPSKGKGQEKSCDDVNEEMKEMDGAASHECTGDKENLSMNHTYGSTDLTNPSPGQPLQEETQPRVGAASSDTPLNTTATPSQTPAETSTAKDLKGLSKAKRNVSSFCEEVHDGIMSVDVRGCCSQTCTCRNFKNKFPILKWLPKYRCPDFQGDLIAGLTVGLTVIPQGLAYAQVADLPPQYGLYSAFMGCFIYCIFGTSKDITLGPTAIMSLMTAAFGSSPVKLDPTYAIILSFMSGIVQLFMGFFSLGFLVDFIPYPVINSFTTSAAVTIAFGQIKKWLGLKNISSDFIPQLIGIFKNIKKTNIWDFVLGLVTMIILYIMKRMKNYQWSTEVQDNLCRTIFKKIIWLIGTARNAIIVVIAAGLAAGLNNGDYNPFSLTGKIQSGLPPFKFPSFSFNGTDGNTTYIETGAQILANIGPGLAIVPLMGVVEAIAIGNAFARKNGYRIDANQELIAIGAANLMGSFVSAYPVTGSFSRTAVNSQSGVRTPAGGVFTGVLIIVALAVLTPWFQYIPSAALAGVIIMAVIDMASFQLIPKLWKVKKTDLLPWFVTFILSFIVGIEYGIICGIAFSLLFLLYPWSRPGVKVVTDTTATPTCPVRAEVFHKHVVIIELDQGIRFPGVDYIKDKVLEQALHTDDVPRSVVLDCRHISNLDYSAVVAVTQLYDDLAAHNLTLVLSGLRPDILGTLKSAEIANLRYAPTLEDATKIIIDELHEGEGENPRQSLLKDGPASSSYQAADVGPENYVSVTINDVEDHSKTP